MKQLTENIYHEGSNAWGGDGGTYRQRFEIELSDVGVVKDHLGGANHSRHKFTEKDVGRTIIVYSDRASFPTNGGWNCWMFSTYMGSRLRKAF